MKFTFKKAERIYKKDHFKQLFQEGQHFLIHPFKVIYCFNKKAADDDPNYPLKFAVSVPKKRFKKAVERNLLKRKTREAFRLHRNSLKHQLKNQDQQLNVLVIYCDPSILEYRNIEDKIILILQRLQGIHEKNNQ